MLTLIPEVAVGYFPGAITKDSNPSDRTAHVAALPALLEAMGRGLLGAQSWSIWVV
jgi:hypothetical protein